MKHITYPVNRGGVVARTIYLRWYSEYKLKLVTTPVGIGRLPPPYDDIGDPILVCSNSDETSTQDTG